MSSPRRADAIVVGGGIMGACTARALAHRGAGRVWLLERSWPAAGSSGKSGAILRQHYSHAETVRLARYGLQAYASFHEATGRDIGFRRPGLLLLAPAAERAGLEANIAVQRAEGVDCELVEGDGLARIEGRGFYEDGLVGCHEPEAGYVDPRRSVEAMVAEAEAAGAVLSVGEEARELVVEGGRVVALRTSHGEIACGQVVLACGPWSGALLREHGWELPLSVVRPEQAFLEEPGDFTASGGPCPVMVDLGSGWYWKGEGARHTRVGKVATDDDDQVHDPDHYDESAGDDFLRAARDGVAHRLPHYREATIWGGVGALYTMTPDSHPVVGPVAGIEGLLVATGFSGHGFKLGPAIGDGLANWVLDGEPKLWPAGFLDPHRFEEGRGIGNRYGQGVLG